MRAVPAAAALVMASALAGCALGRAMPPSPRQSRPQLDASAMLRQLYTLEMAYRAMNGEFASTTEALKTVGWEDENLRGGYYPWIVHHGRRLCVAVLPARRPPVAASIDGAGRLFRGPYCGRLR